jgi:hypothetical protein
VKLAKISLAETETIFRWDLEERVLWACTTDKRVKTRWIQSKFPVQVLSKTREGKARSWTVKLPYTEQARKRGKTTNRWPRCFQDAVKSVGQAVSQDAILAEPVFKPQ